ncbi:MAG: hypothetical protein JXQ96_15425 [Cyclobacteriaceae bacterium]
MKVLLLAVIVSVLFMPYTFYAQGCAAPSSDEGVTIWGYLQPEFAANFEDDTRAAFSFRRMRIGAMGNIPYDFSYYVLLETSQFANPNSKSPYLLDAFVSYNRFRNARIAIGSFKYPFGLELTNACHGLYTIRRSKIVNEMTADYDAVGNRDMGVMILGGSDTTRFTYKVALTNGYGVTNVNPNLMDSYSLTARVTFKPINPLRIGVSVRNGELPPESSDVTKNDTKMRLGFDVAWKYNNLYLMGEYIDGEDKGSFTTGGGCDGPGEIMTGQKTTSGWYFMAVYRFANNFEPVYKIEGYKANKSNPGEVASLNDEESSTCQTFGLNYYPNDWTRLQLNYTYSAESPTEVNNDALLLQLQIRF